MDKEFLTEHRMKLAGDYESSGKYLHAIQIYNSILDENPSCHTALMKMADLYRKMGNLEPAKKILTEFIKEFPEQKEVRLYYSEFLLNNAMWEDAIEVLSYFTPEEEPVSSFFTGYSHFMLKEFEIAKISFNNFIRHSNMVEMKCEANFFLAKIEIELQDYKAGLENLKNAEAILNDLWEYHYLTALCYYNLGMYAHALPAIKQSLKLNAAEPVHYNLAGKVCLKLGDYLNAEKYLRTYIDMKEKVAADTYAFLAEACLQNKKSDEALMLFDKALAEDPANKFALDGKKNANDIIKNNRVSDG
jgi:tetratricopeptide (TPR) repeat protein